jgi:hypothetical protein
VHSSAAFVFDWHFVVISSKVPTADHDGTPQADYIGVWQGVAMDFLKFHPGPPYPTLLRSAGGPPLKGLTAIYGVARPQGEWPVAVF